MKALHITIALFLLLISVIDILSANDDTTDYYNAENIYKFAEHLYQEGEYARSANEYERYLLTTQDKNDIALYRLGLCYRNVGEIQKAINAFNRLKNGHNDWSFPASYQIAYSYLASEQNKNFDDYISTAIQETQSIDNASKLRILLAYSHLKQRRWITAAKSLETILQSDDRRIKQLSSELRERSLEGINLRRKSRLLASVVSAIIPGAGKMYCGQYGNGIYSFATVSATGLVAWRGFHNDGLSSVKGWIFGSLCAIFYSGNVYGSGISALAHNRQVEEEILMRLPLLPNEW